jgi:hypothetical protein
LRGGELKASEHRGGLGASAAAVHNTARTLLCGFCPYEFLSLHHRSFLRDGTNQVISATLSVRLRQKWHKTRDLCHKCDLYRRAVEDSAAGDS